MYVNLTQTIVRSANVYKFNLHFCHNNRLYAISTIEIAPYFQFGRNQVYLTVSQSVWNTERIRFNLKGQKKILFLCRIFMSVSYCFQKGLNGSKTKYNISGSPIRSAKINPA